MAGGKRKARRRMILVFVILGCLILVGVLVGLAKAGVLPHWESEFWAIFMLSALCFIFFVPVNIWLVVDMHNKKIRARRALGENIAQEQCVACGSSDVTHPEPDTILCADCGYEGGEGVAKRVEMARIDRIRGLSPEVRLSEALDDLLAAQSHLADALKALDWFLENKPRFSLDTTSYIGASCGGNYNTRTEWEVRLGDLMNNYFKVQGYMEDAADKVETLNPDELPQGFEMEDWTLGQDVTQLKAEVEESETVMDIRGPLKKLVYVLARHKAAFPR